MGRSVADGAMLQNVLAGPHKGDQASLRPAYVLPTEFSPAEGVRVALCVNLGDYEVDPAIEANTRAAGDALRSAGVQVEEVSLPWTRQSLVDTAWAHFGAVMGPFIQALSADHFDQLMPYTRAFAAHSSRGGSYAEGLIAEAELYRPLGELLERYDALLCPTLAFQGIAADEESAGGTVAIDGADLPWIDALMTMPFNVIGRVPVLSVPSGIAPNGVPTGVQIVGRTYDDGTVFRVGEALERALSLWTSPDWWPAL